MIRLLVPLDGSKLAEQAILHAATFASAFEAELHLLQVVEPNTHDPQLPFDNFDWEMRCSQSQCYLQDLAQALAGQRIEAHIHVVEGNPPTEIIEFSKTHRIDLILLCTHGAGGINQFPKGSTVQKVISNTDASLLLVRPDESALRTDVHYRRILVMLDGSRRSDWALQLAAIIARAADAELSLLQVVQTPVQTPGVRVSTEGRQLAERLVELNRIDAQKHLDELKNRLPSDITVRIRVLVGPEIAPLVQQVAEEDDIDLLVLSAHGMSIGNYWLYGPIAESILAHASLPLLVFQDIQERSITLKPRSGTPARAVKAERPRNRAEAS
ncbi:MAG: universal stress protein [Pseudomonadales bacterium]